MGVLYGVGVGPGDPELITVKALKVIEACDILAVIGEDPAKSSAYRIAAGIVPDIEKKQLLALSGLMKRDKASLENQHRLNADLLEEYLDKDKRVCFLTLGDPNIYSSFSYIRRLVVSDGYEVETVSGVTSFCAAASALGISLADWDESVHIIPAGQVDVEASLRDGTCILMKPRGDMAAFKEKLRRTGWDIRAVIDCGRPGERICGSIDEIPDDAGYFTLMIARKYEKDR